MLSNKLFTVPFVFISCVIMGSIIYIACKYSIYVAVNKERLDPLGLIYLERASHGFYDLATFGDSRAFAWGEFYAERGRKVLNLGISNQTSAQARYRIDYQGKSLELGIIIIQVGINDLKQIDSDNYESIVNNCKDNIDYIAHRAKSLAKTVVVTTIFPLGDPPLWRRMLIPEEIYRAINEVNAHIVGIEGVKVYDAYKFLVNSNGYVKDIYSRDTLHLSDRGYEEMDVLRFAETANSKIP